MILLVAWTEGMMPNYDDMNGEGIINLEDASIQGENIIQAISAITKFGGDSLKIGSTKVTFQILNGRIYIDPYDVNYGGYDATISGSNGFDGSMDYIVSTEVPTGVAGDAINNLVSSYTGGKSVVGETIPINLNIKGTYDNPKVGLAGSSSSGNNQSAMDAAKVAAKAELERQKKIAEEKAKAEIAKQKKRAKEELAKQKKLAEEELAKQKKLAEERAKAEIKAQKKKAKEEAAKQKKIAEEKAKAELEKAKKEAEKALNSLFKKKN